MPSSVGYSPGRLVQVGRRVRRWYQKRLRQWQRMRGRNRAEAETELLLALDSPTPSRRWQAAAALGKYSQRSQAAIDALIELLADPEPFVRWHAAEALAAQQPDHVFPTLRELLVSSPHPLRRAGAALALGRMGGEAACLELVKGLHDKIPYVRLAVAEAMGECADPASAALLQPLLKDPREEVQRAAAAALGKIGTQPAARALADVLEQPGHSLLMRRSLSAALARTPHPEVQSVLLQRLADPDPQVRAYCADALGHVGSEEAATALESMRDDESALLRGTVGEVARRSLAMLERRGRRPGPPPSPEQTSADPVAGSDEQGD